MKDREPTAEAAETALQGAGPAEESFTPSGIEGLLRGDANRAARRDPRAARHLLALQRSAGNAAVASLLRQVAPPELPRLRVAREPEALLATPEAAGAFLDQVKAAVTAVAEDEIDPQLFRVQGCPWIEHWIGYYRTKAPDEVLEAVRRYAPSAAGVADTEALVAAVCERVRDGIRTWKTSGEMPVPANAPKLSRFPLGPGRPLDPGVRDRMAPALGHSLDGVRLHTDAPLDAPAAAIGRHIAFAPGRYEPGTPIGDAMIAHELAHVVQQDGPGASSDHELEGDADQAALGAVSALHQPGLARRAVPALRGGLKLQRCGFDGPAPDTAVYGKAPKTSEKAFDRWDVPGETPKVNTNWGSSFHFDGDGDQFKDMAADIKQVETWPDGAPKLIRVDITQLFSGNVQTSEFSLPSAADGGAPLQVMVTEVTDGLHPTEVSLVAAGNLKLEISPGREEKGMTRMTVTLVEKDQLNGPASELIFPGTHDQTSVFGDTPAEKFAAPAGRLAWARQGDISWLDQSVGAYGDRFRFSVSKPDPASPATVFGVSVLSEGAPVAGQRADLDVPKPLKPQLLREDAVRMEIDLDGDGKADVGVYDRLTEAEGGPPVVNRDHEITVAGPAVHGGERSFYYPVRDGRIKAGEKSPEAGSEQAASQARAVTGLQQQSGLHTPDDELLQLDMVLIRLRVLARDEKLISPELYDAWWAAARTMTILGPSIAAGAVSPSLKQQAKTDLTAFGVRLDAETAAADKMDDGSQLTDKSSGEASNPYSGAKVLRHEGRRIVSDAWVKLVFAVKEDKWDTVKAEYRKFTDGLDRWIAAKNREKHPFADPSKPESMRAAAGEQYAGQRRSLGKLEGKDRTRVSAVLHLTEAYEEKGEVSEVPLSMYYWRDGDEWHLIDVTRPDDTPTWSAPAKAGETVPPRALFQKLDDNAHFPPGLIRYLLPDGSGGQARTTGPGTLRKVFTAIAVAGALAGIVLMPIGGRIAVAGAYVLAGSALVGAGLAVADIVDRWRHDNVTGEAILLDAMDIINAFIGLGSMKAGQILTGVRQGAAAGRPMVMNPAIGWANRYYLPLRAAEATTGVITLAVIHGQLMEAMEQVRKGGGKDQNKAFLHLFLQFAMTTGLTALSVRGVIPELTTGRNLAIHTVNGVDYAVPVGQSVQGRAIDAGRASLGEGPPETAGARQEKYLSSIASKIEGAPGATLADVERMALRPGSDGALKADAAGNLTRNGAPWTTLQELADEVNAANNVATAHGMNAEYAIRIGPAGPDGHADVRVVSEPRPHGAPGADAAVADATVRQYLASQTGRTQASNAAMAKLRKLDPASAIEIRPDGRLRINNQIDIDAARIADIEGGRTTAAPKGDAALGEKQLKTLLDGTRELDKVGGDIGKLKKDAKTKTLAGDLEKLAQTGAYRLRMEYHAGEGRSWAAGLKLNDTQRGRLDALIANADEDGRMRLFDIPNEAAPRGKKNANETQSFLSGLALDQSPRDVEHFVSLYQYYRAELIRRAELIGQRARRAVADKHQPSQAAALEKEGVGRPGQPATAEELVWKQMHDTGDQEAMAKRWHAEVAERRADTGHGIQIGLGADDTETIGRIRSNWPIPMHDAETATYHVNKHHRELLPGEQFDPEHPRPGISSEWDAYMELARNVVHDPATNVSGAASQDGLGRVFTFKLDAPGKPTRTVLVLVDYDGTATLLTFIPGKPK